jgi:hypothetical protein
VSRFEALCAERRIELPFEVLSELYDDPTDLRKIEDPHLRMQARSLIVQASWAWQAGGWSGGQPERQAQMKSVMFKGHALLEAPPAVDSQEQEQAQPSSMHVRPDACWLPANRRH